MNAWRNLKIGVRLGVGIGAVLMLLVIVAVAASLGLSGGNANFAEYRGMARQTTSAGAMNSELLMARMHVKDFLLQGTDQSVEAVSQAIDDLRAAIKENEGLFAGSEEDRQAMATIAEAAQGYHDAFVKVTELRKQRDVLVHQLNETGPKIEKNLSAVMESAYRDADAEAAYRMGDATSSLLLGRLYMSKFLTENLPEHVERTRAELSAFESKLSTALSELQNPERRRLTQEAIELTKAYEANFEELQGVIFARNEIIDGTMNKVGPEMAQRLDDIVSGKKAAQDELGPRAAAEMNQSMVVALTISAIALALGLIAGFIIARGITRPIAAMTSAMGVLANGDTTVEIPARGQKDEIGVMAGAVQVFKDNMIETDRMRLEQEETKKRTEAERRQAMLDLADKFEASVGGVVESVTSAATELQATAQSLSATAEETSQQSNAVAAASEQMTQNVQTVASATEELSSSIREIGNQVTESTRIVGTAVTQADDTNAKVKTLAEAAQKIGDVVTLINEIAAQTNLLALNATIEAARAGEAGKGFAVVASEVKNLATQTAKATEEIAGQVRAIQEATGTSAQAIDSISQTINRVNEISTAIASAVEEQGAATQEIARNVQEASTGTSEVTNNIAGVTQASQQTSAGSTQVLSAASELAKNGEKLRQEVGNFLATVRAA
jgi:methyl-accepting chemotaxis protein